MVLGLGLVFGFFPFLSFPLVVLDPDQAGLVRFAFALDCATILPACLLAFWFRRTAAVWLVLNAAVLALALVRGELPHEHFAVSVAFVLAAFLTVCCLGKWPAVLGKK